MSSQPRNNRKGPRPQKRASNSKLPHICANCSHWSWKNGCSSDKNAAPSKTCGRFAMGRYASYAVDKRGKVAKVDPATYNGNGASEAVAVKKSSFTDWVVRELKKRDIAYVDNRSKESDMGCLWIVGGNTPIMQQVMAEFAEMGAAFKFTEKGGKASGDRPAWCLRGYPKRK